MSKGMSLARTGAAMLALVALAACQRYASPEDYRGGYGASPIALSSQSMALPEETVTLPASAEIVTTNCTACHSPDLILSQPKLTPEQWHAEVAKMRGAYKAAIDEKDDDKIVAALLSLQK